MFARSILPLLVVFGSALALGGCAPSQDPSLQPGAPSPGGPEMQAPLVVSLSQVGTNPATNETDIAVAIDVPRPLSYPVTMTVYPPPGGQLVTGLPQEVLTLAQAGRLTRTYRVRSAGPLTPDAALRVVVDGQSADHGAGLHADRQFPPRPEMVVPHNGVAPPGGRPPGAAPHY